MRRRTLLAATAAGALTGGLATACGGPSQARPGQTVLRFWSWVPGIENAVDLWNSQGRDTFVNLEFTPAGGSGTYAKMYAAVRGGRGAPDVAQVEYQELPGFALENGLVEVGPLGMTDRASEFVDWQLAMCTFSDRIYAVPQASGPMGLYYRADILDEVGLQPPTTWDEFAAAAETVRSSGPDRYLVAFPPQNAAWFGALAWQAGAQWFGVEDGTWTVGVADDASRRVAEYWDDLRRNDLISVQPDFASRWYNDLQLGRLVTWPSAQWGGALLASNAGDSAGAWRVAPLPQWNAGEMASGNWGGSSTAILKGCQHPQAAAEFALWLNTDPESIDLLIAGGYGWPAIRNGLEGTALDAPDPLLGGQNGNREVFAVADQNIDSDWQWGPTTANTYAHINDAFAGVVAGQGTLVEALERAQEQTVEDIEDKGLTVESNS
ncbi:ABC transporter substrate-binding protein [Kineococcus sp. TBRC 1896]|uniref:ABC transporter substrate-binding protein n=1 Tax=Kineococcus mangrovi TaxID=1660183 RepID=A0ABV4I2F0_9ACTN